LAIFAAMRRRQPMRDVSIGFALAPVDIGE